LKKIIRETIGLATCLTSTGKNVVKCVEVIIPIQLAHAVIHVILLHARVSNNQHNTYLAHATDETIDLTK